MDLVNFREIALYYPLAIDADNNLYNQGQIKTVIFEDNCGFGYHYNTSNKRDIFSLNVKDTLIIVIDKSSFLYDLNTNTMKSKGSVSVNHKGGSLVYCPFDNLVYCIAGISTNIVETINIFDEENLEENKTYTELAEPRAYFASYIQDKCKIWVLLGYNYINNDFITSIERLDTSSSDKTWKEYSFFNEESVPKLVFISCTPSSNEKIHIFGGIDENYFINKVIYIICLMDNSFEIYPSNLALPFTEESQSQKISLNKEFNNKGFTCLFYQENCFIPLLTNVTDKDTFLYGLFDSKHNLHLTNLNNFNYCLITRKEEKEEKIKNAIKHI
jgi:hypothetical protein